MANASKDQNGVSSLLGVSSSDGTTPVPIYADPTTHALYVQSGALTGTGVPGSTPTFIGQTYVNTAGPAAYIAVGTSSSSDWKLIT